jgi:hypothetical protein
MKFSALCKLALAGYLLICSAATIGFAADMDFSSLTFVRLILNASPNVVQEKLGKPDHGVKPTNDCPDEKMQNCDHATYKNGKFEATFYKGRLKTLSIYGNDLFGKNALEIIGFSSAPPTWSNQFVHSWRNAAHKGTASGPLIPFEGIDDINVFPAKGQSDNLGYMVISVSVTYNKAFAK